jgi:hypothetical protein
VDTYTRISDPALGQEPRYSLGVSHTILAKREEQLREARKLRNADVRALVGDLGPAQVAKASGLSLSSIKSITRPRGP